MTQSPEYPDLLWMPPKSWSMMGRSSVQLVVIHTTEGSEGPNSAEDGASYDQRRTDGTSTHFFHDSNSTVQCVRTADVAHAARTQGNKRGIQHELCGRAGQGGAGWADAVSQGTLRQAARQVARDCGKWNIPVRHLTVAQVAAGEKGICGHVDITRAFPQDNGTHTDPGPDFPWSAFLTMVRDEMEDTVTPENIAAIAEAVADRLRVGDKGIADKLGADLNGDPSGVAAGVRRQVTNAVAPEFAAIRTAIAALAQPTITLTGEQITAIGAIVAQAAGGAVTDLQERLKAAGIALSQ